MRISKFLVLFTVLFATTIVGLLPLTSGTAHAGKRKASPPKFQLQYFDIPGRGPLMASGDINDLGQVVGYYQDAAGELRGFFYDPEISATTAIDLETMIGGSGVPEGWHVTHAKSINNFGIILGEMAGIDLETGNKVRWGFVIDINAPSPTVIPLPEIPGVDEFSVMRPMSINNDGDILCQYTADGARWIFVVNPFTQAEPQFLNQPVWDSYSSKIANATSSHSAIVGTRLADGTLARWTPETNTLQRLEVNGTHAGINDAGHIAGYYNGFAMRLITPPPKTFNVGYQLLPGAGGINNSSDVTIGGGYLYRDDVGLINLTNYLSASTADRALWTGALSKGVGGITERDSKSNYGRMIGSLTFRDSAGQLCRQPFILTPIVTNTR